MGVQIRSLGIGLQRIYHGVSTKPQKSGVPIRPIPPELLRQIYENLNYRSLPWSWLVGSRALPGYLQYAHGYKTRLRVYSVLAARIKGAIKMMMNWQTVVQQWSSTCKWADKDALNVKNFPLRHHALGQCACARVSPTQCVVRCHLVKYTDTYDDTDQKTDRQRDGRTDGLWCSCFRGVWFFLCERRTRVFAPSPAGALNNNDSFTCMLWMKSDVVKFKPNVYELSYRPTRIVLPKDLGTSCISVFAGVHRSFHIGESTQQSLRGPSSLFSCQHPLSHPSYSLFYPSFPK